MLHLLRKNVLRNMLSPRVRVWGHLTLVSMILHVGILLCLFVWYRGNNAFLALHVRRNASSYNLPVVIVGTLSGAQKKVGASPIKNATIVQSTQKKTKLQSRTTIQATKKAPVKKQAKKVAPQPKKKPAVAKKVEQKKNIQKKEPQQKKQIITKKTKSPQKMSHASKAAQSNVFENPVIVAKNYKEKIAIKQQQALQQELARVWQPPVGAEKNTTCCMKVLVGSNGRIKHMDVVESSGILLFDVAARSALCKAQLPRWTWGTTLALTFS